MAPVELHEAAGADLDLVETILDEAGLPVADLRDGPGTFFVATTDRAVVGTGGLERYDRNGLLRSVAVQPALRGRGYGSAICGRLEAVAGDGGVERLFLLTGTAAGFFERLGYRPVGRETVPGSVRRTREFADLCPDSADVMLKYL